MENGLTSKEAEAALFRFGENNIEEAKKNKLLEIAGRLLLPTSLMLELAWLISTISGRGYDADIILFLLIFNLGISYYHEYNAKNAIEALKEKIRIKTKVFRDGKLIKIDSMKIVPGDLIFLEKGDVCPADCTVVDSSEILADESMLTGESFPKTKSVGDRLFATSIIKAGEGKAKVTATATGTYFGKTIKLVESGNKQGVMEKDVILTAKFLIAVGLACMVILTAYFLFAGKEISSILTLDLSLAIVSFPVAFPTVIALVSAIGIFELSKKQVIVRRMSSLEDISNVNLLISDKTGTLTKNEIRLEKIVLRGISEKDLLEYSYACCGAAADDAIDVAIVAKALAAGIELPKITEYVPATPESKKSQSKVERQGREIKIAKGSAMVIINMCNLPEGRRMAEEGNVAEFSKEGFRAIAVALDEGKGYALAGYLLFIDPPREDALKSIQNLKEYSIDVKIATGDDRFVARHLANQVGIQGGEVSRKDGMVIDGDLVERNSIFSELYPEDKYQLVRAAKQNHVVAVTGDGVNDIPAISEADVGIAVSTATDATKNSADIILLSPGIGVVNNALIEGKKVFEKIYYYSIYRISESFRIILTIFIISLILGDFPLTPLQLILLSLINDIPIIAIAFDNVRVAKKPQKIDFKKRTATGMLLGLTGLVNSLVFLVLATTVFGFGIPQIQTAFFLKMSLGGHFLLLIARERESWHSSWPSKLLLAALFGTQILASILALTGTFMPKLAPEWVVFMWAYTFFWMQISDFVKITARRFSIFRA